MTKVFCVAAQKGGVGKSCTTAILSTLLSYEFGFNVAVIDADPQQSLVSTRTSELREHAIKLIQRESEKPIEEIRREYSPDKLLQIAMDDFRSGHIVDMLSIPLHQGEMLLDHIKEIKQRGEFRSKRIDLLFVDLPAGFNEIAAEVLNLCDGVLIPVVGANTDIKSTANFLRQLQLLSREHGGTMNFNLRAFINKRRGVQEEQTLEDFMRHVGLESFESSLGHYESYGRFSTIISFTRYKASNPKARKESWVLLLEFIRQFEILKDDFSDLKDYIGEKQATLRLENVRNCISKFITQNNEESNEELITADQNG